MSLKLGVRQVSEVMKKARDKYHSLKRDKDRARARLSALFQ